MMTTMLKIGAKTLIQRIIIWPNMCTAALSSNRNARGMIAQNYSSRSAISADIVDQTSLEREQRFEFQCTEQIGGQRPAGRKQIVVGL